MKSHEEIMNMLEAFDVAGSLRGAGELAGVSHHTVARYVAERDAGALAGGGPQRRERIIDPWLPKIEEWVERSHAKIRADRAFDKLKALCGCPKPCRGWSGSSSVFVDEVLRAPATHRKPCQQREEPVKDATHEVPGWSAKPLVSAHDRIMGTHRTSPTHHPRQQHD